VQDNACGERVTGLVAEPCEMAGACPSEAAAAGNTPQEVKQAAIGAIFVIGGGFLGPLAEGLGLLGSAAADTEAAAADATADATSDSGDLVEQGCGESFTASTRVLLASGAAIPISQLKPGDKVLATNTKTGKNQAEPVTAVMVKRDNDKYDLSVRSGHRTTVIDTTRNHLFWDDTLHRWVKAEALKYGDHLRTSNGTIAAVVSGYAPADSAGWMWDITVPGNDDHDFYVDTTVAAVLVHNCPAGPGDRVPKAPRGSYGKSAVPSWVINEGYTPYVGETPAQTAARIMNEQYGEGNWSKGPGSEYNQILKWASRHF
jgi:hypothetical protein